MDNNKKIELIKKIMNSLSNRKIEQDNIHKTMGEILSNSKLNSENEKKIKDLTPNRPNDETMDIVYEGINFKVKIWYDDNYNTEFKIAEAELNEENGYDKLSRIDSILSGLFESEVFKTDGEANLNRLIEKFILDENYEEAKKIKMIMEKNKNEKDNLIDFKNIVTETYEKILDYGDDFKLDDEIIKNFDNFLKKLKKDRKK